MSHHKITLQNHYYSYFSLKKSRNVVLSYYFLPTPHRYALHTHLISCSFSEHTHTHTKKHRKQGFLLPTKLQGLLKKILPHVINFYKWSVYQKANNSEVSHLWKFSQWSQFLEVTLNAQERKLTSSQRFHLYISSYLIENCFQ